MPLTYSCPGLGRVFLDLAAEGAVVPLGRLALPLHRGGQLPGHGAEVDDVNKTQGGVWLRKPREDVELLSEGLSQGRERRVETGGQSVKASLTAWAGAQGSVQENQHRLASEALVR